MGPTWGRQDPGGPHVGPMNLAIREAVVIICWSLRQNMVSGGNNPACLSDKMSGVMAMCETAVWSCHYSDVIMSTLASEITSLTILYSTVYLGAEQRKHQNFASLAIVRGIHHWPVNSPHTGPVTWRMFPFDDVIMLCSNMTRYCKQHIHDKGGTCIAFWTHKKHPNISSSQVSYVGLLWIL